VIWGFVVSTVLVYHGTFLVNSVCHVLGRRRYPTADESRNNWWVALLTFGEGWHNNHHHYMSSARQGFRWWEIDPTFYILKGLSKLRVVWDLKLPPEAVLRNEQRLGSRVIDRAARQLAASFNADRIAAVITSALASANVVALQEQLSATQRRAADVLANLHLPQLPTRPEILDRALAMYAVTPSIEDIVDRAHALILEAIGARLCPSARCIVD
jgi:stearoyl-CoA desaturase (delta-9 desaturase)